MMRVSKHVEVRDVQCERFEAELHRGVVGAQDLRFTHKHKTQVEDLEGDMVAFSVRFVGFVEIETKLESEGLDWEGLATLKAEFHLTYQLAPKASRDLSDLNEFGRGNVLSTAWPYWREYVMTSLSRLGLPAYTIPVLRVQPKPPEEPPPALGPGEQPN